jgi:hypothetical protein
LEDVYSANFGDTTGWTLINRFTIHKPERVRDRQMMVNSVPKGLSVTMHDIRAVESIEWANDDWIAGLTVDDDGNLVPVVPAAAPERGYVRKRSITGTGTLEDRITLFTLEEGAVAQYTSLGSVFITPLPSGLIGGKHSATISDGGGFSGWSSRDVPEGGLMEIEPGKIWLHDGEHDPEQKPQILAAELHIDTEQFDAIFQVIRDGAQNIKLVKLRLAAELFEDEVDAALSEWWMPHEYGLLKDKDWTQTHARLDSIHVSFAAKTMPSSLDESAAPEQPEQLEQPEQPAPASPPTQMTVQTTAQLQHLNATARWILLMLLVLVAVTLFK